MSDLYGCLVPLELLQTMEGSRPDQPSPHTDAFSHPSLLCLLFLCRCLPFSVFRACDPLSHVVPKAPADVNNGDGVRENGGLSKNGDGCAGWTRLWTRCLGLCGKTSRKHVPLSWYLSPSSAVR